MIFFIACGTNLKLKTHARAGSRMGRDTSPYRLSGHAVLVLQDTRFILRAIISS